MKFKVLTALMTVFMLQVVMPPQTTEAMVNNGPGARARRGAAAAVGGAAAVGAAVANQDMQAVIQAVIQAAAPAAAQAAAQAAVQAAAAAAPAAAPAAAAAAPAAIEQVVRFLGNVQLAGGNIIVIGLGIVGAILAWKLIKPINTAIDNFVNSYSPSPELDYSLLAKALVQDEMNKSSWKELSCKQKENLCIILNKLNLSFKDCKIGSFNNSNINKMEEKILKKYTDAVKTALEQSMNYNSLDLCYLLQVYENKFKDALGLNMDFSPYVLPGNCKTRQLSPDKKEKLDVLTREVIPILNAVEDVLIEQARDEGNYPHFCEN